MVEVGQRISSPSGQKAARGKLGSRTSPGKLGALREGQSDESGQTGNDPSQGWSKANMGQKV